jgi:type II secretory pathway pseudopilin PulG
MAPRMNWKRGFTAIEMMVVVSIVILLVAMVVPTIGPAIKKGHVNDAASAIQRACSMARQLSRSNSEPKASGAGLVKHYGVAVVVPGEGGGKLKPAYAVVVYGDRSLTDASYVSNPDNQYPNGTPDPSTAGAVYGGIKPSGKFDFNSNVLPFIDQTVSIGAPLDYKLMAAGTSVGWYYQYRTGFVFTDINNASKAVDIGVASTGANPQSFGVATLDIKYKVAIAIYKIGLLNAQDMY